MDFSCGCLSNESTKEPHFKKSRHFEDLSASFAINAKNEQLDAHYSWLTQLHRELPVPEPYVEASLENPADKSRPIITPAVRLTATSGSTPFEHPRYYVLSPALPTLNCGVYKMTLTAYSDRSKSKILTQHENELLSRVNTSSCPKSEFMEKMNAAAQHASKDWETRL